MAYSDLLEHARMNRNLIKLYAGFIPRTFAKQVMKESESAAVDAAKKMDYIPQDTQTLEGTDLHYNLFESMLSGRSMHDPSKKPSDNFRRIFKA
jgi:Haem-binding uptake, Tiki superfamily, ChaN